MKELTDIFDIEKTKIEQMALAMVIELRQTKDENPDWDENKFKNVLFDILALYHNFTDARKYFPEYINDIVLLKLKLSNKKPNIYG